MATKRSKNKARTRLSKTVVATFGDTAVPKPPLTVQTCFEHVVENFISGHEDLFRLIETIILSHLLVEIVIKDGLRAINPALVLEAIDAEDVAIVSGKKAALLNSTKDDAKSAKFTVLLGRYLQFENVTRYRKSLDDLALLRNRIAHAGAGIKLGVNEHAVLLSRFIFPFIKERVEISPYLWKDFEKIQHLVYNEFMATLGRKIIAHRRKVNGVSASVIQQRIDAGPELMDHGVTGGEYEEFENLPCPACGHKSTSIVNGVEIEDADGRLAHGWSYSICSVCDLKMNREEQEEIALRQPDKYFRTVPDMGSWESALVERDSLDFM